MRTIADRYRLVGPLGRGGMGQVWEGSDLRLNRRIAVKLIHRADLANAQEAVRRFHREARITARMSHPGVPAVYDFGNADDELFVAMEYIEGQTVSDLIAEESPLPVPWAAYLAAQACSVLAAAHAGGLVHRDIKPSNLLLTRHGAVKVIDFGAAAAPGLPQFSRITQTGQVPGTARYVAPELYEGVSAGPSSDLYAVGRLLEELLGEERYDVPSALVSLVDALLLEDPQDRPSDATGVFTALHAFIGPLPHLPGALASDLRTDPTHLYTTTQAKAFPSR
ncbi:serine/threonine-protein kinase [Actinocorallia libanotica]|uniref:non-specific serine/threonine protein kinase n=1 Tax=Actinocorallia libanotica TaxID=46162 RepID=A0ABP4CBG6_9ACTN